MSRWSTCVICGMSHPPARFANGGPPRCYHCGGNPWRCQCVRFPVWLLYAWLGWIAFIGAALGLLYLAYWLGTQKWPV